MDKLLVQIRPETPADHAAIREILIAAFAHHPFSRQTEHLIVEALRSAGAMTLALVAEVDGSVVGHVAFSPAPINGEDCGWYMLGPVAVAPEVQRRGVGQALVNAGLAKLRRLGARGCALVGDPAYYPRFGFRNAAELNVKDVPPEVFFCLPMEGPIPHGELTHHEAFWTGL